MAQMNNHSLKHSRNQHAKGLEMDHSENTGGSIWESCQPCSKSTENGTRLPDTLAPADDKKACSFINLQAFSGLHLRF
jgi:hypothetical protein